MTSHLPQPHGLELAVFPLLSDNTGALLRDPESGLTAAVDVPDAEGVLAAAKARGWTISHIFVTHEHADHIQGVAALKAATGATVIGPSAAAGAAPLDHVVGEGDTVEFGPASFAIWETPGHSPGHLSWVAEDARVALVGDVLFVLGCGRLSGDTAPQLWAALKRLAALPDDTVLVTGHDYTWSNARFALSVDGGNSALKVRAEQARERAEAKDFWGVTTVGEELATNPFLRADSPLVATAAGLQGADPGEVFARLRQMKNEFRG